MLRFGLVLSSVVMLAWVVEAQKAPAPGTSEEVQDVVFLGEGRPVLLRLRVLLDGKPFRAAHQTAWDDYVRPLFRHLDRNGDGVLSEAEAERLPPPQMGFSRGESVNVAFNFAALDADGNGQVTLKELTGYCREFSNGPLRIHLDRTPRPGVEALGTAVWTLLDKNKDGKLSQAELKEASAVLFRLDKDDDELLSPQELSPNLNNAALTQVNIASATAGSRIDANRFLIARDNADLGRKILARYGAAEEQKLGRASLGMDPAFFNQLDRDQDGFLNAAELGKFTDRPADLELTVRLGRRDPTEVAVEGAKPAGGFTPPRATGGGSWLLALGRDQIGFQANQGRPIQPVGLRRNVLQQFHDADSAQAGFLDQKQVNGRDFFPSMFPLFDRDGDGRLAEPELLSYLDHVQDAQVRALTSVVSLRVTSEGRGLFDLLDSNRDGRLSQREVKAAATLLGLWDGDADGLLAPEELPRAHRLAVGVGQASFGHSAGDGKPIAAPAGLPLLALTWSPARLLWFFKMDHNGDDDVSQREFLGSRADFQRLDTDGDGLISMEEAEQAANRLDKEKK